MPEFARPDVTLHYEVQGSSRPVLMLAGMFSDSASWAPLLPLLSGHTLICPDNRSTGRTQLTSGQVDCAAMADDAVALMDHLGHDHFAIVGHSLGGLLGLEIAAAHPKRVTQLAMLGSAQERSARLTAIFDGLLAIRRAPEGEEMWLRTLYPWLFGEAFFETPGAVEMAIEAARAHPHAQSVAAMAAQIEAFSRFRPAADPARVLTPSLAIYGGQDLLIPSDAARRGFAEMPNVTHRVIETAGHSMVWDAPQEVATLLTAFLARGAG